MLEDIPIDIKPIGVIHSELKTATETPKNFTESEQIGTLEIFPEYQEAMSGLKIGQTLVVLFWLHRARRDLLKLYPRGDKSLGLQGVFNTRSPIRPNPIAISELKITSIEENKIEVVGVDVFAGTPILDIKKKI